MTAIVGAQWGDEGKGKITDLLAQEADVVIRFQGGNNAGHTVVNQHGTFKLHLVPSGIFNPDALCGAMRTGVQNADEPIRFRAVFVVGRGGGHAD